MRRILGSYRWRRRLRWTGAASAVLGLAIGLGLHFNSTPAPSRPAAGPVAVYHAPKTVRVTPRERRQADRAIQRFVHTAVVRREPASSWSLVTPNLRAGTSRRDWNAGNIPVVPWPHPASTLGRVWWQVVYSYPQTLGADVYLAPKPKTGFETDVFRVELKPAGSGAQRRFLVDVWSPQSSFAPVTSAPATKSGGKGHSVAEPAPGPVKGQLSTSWLLLVLAVVLGLVAAPIVYVGVRRLVRRRRLAA